MQSNLIDIVLILFGLASLYAALVQPRFFWESNKMKQTREIMGDKNSRILYIVTGLVMLAVGLYGMMGGFS